MIKATSEHHVTLKTDDKRTAKLVDVLHNMSEWLNEGLITKDTYVHLHEILRFNLDTENFILVAGYRDEREEKNEYSIRVIEFPVEADGTIRKAEYNEEEQAFYLLSKEEEIFKAIENSGGLK